MRLSASAGLFTSLTRDGDTIELCVDEYSWFELRNTKIIAMPNKPGCQKLVGRRFSSFNCAAQEAFKCAFGERCAQPLSQFIVHLVGSSWELPDPVSPTIYCQDRRKALLESRPLFESHLRTTAEARRVRPDAPSQDSGVTTQPIGRLCPLIPSNLSTDEASKQFEAMSLTAISALGSRSGASLANKAARRNDGCEQDGSIQGNKRMRRGGDGSRALDEEPAVNACGASASSKAPKWRLRTKEGNVVWLRDLSKPTAFVVCGCRDEAPLVPQGTAKVLGVRPVEHNTHHDVDDQRAPLEWLHASKFGGSDEMIPKVWLERLPLITDTVERMRVEGVVEAALRQLQKHESAVLPRAVPATQLWEKLFVRHAHPPEPPAFLRAWRDGEYSDEAPPASRE